ncbi:unnamed protein product [Cyprideis torosa]|uniref:Uncharacterized protein n=1 Tax=Cyprideis torosa TaxID=163714 RepID=A0A7R8W7Z8_9CRUS|nr:unnamed protein product [Cyprideis torosa]CAG0883765.1 unnamed protein product [Cyprideis torosa]
MTLANGPLVAPPASVSRFWYKAIVAITTTSSPFIATPFACRSPAPSSSVASPPISLWTLFFRRCYWDCRRGLAASACFGRAEGEQQPDEVVLEDDDEARGLDNPLSYMFGSLLLRATSDAEQPVGDIRHHSLLNPSVSESTVSLQSPPGTTQLKDEIAEVSREMDNYEPHDDGTSKLSEMIQAAVRCVVEGKI